ncbi:MAG: hypothetical protein H8E80_09270 [Desulfobacteraceae bacterium]|uniref:Uncharacterized protein n=1 Tax=Candidatus Desulfaltia bathyphila TaxID=2841697 RepID=A0A8J6N7N6_9BACT|nr:hypothetical protein [Candidatus Desulfaltia bathyphila]
MTTICPRLLLNAMESFLIANFFIKPAWLRQEFNKKPLDLVVVEKNEEELRQVMDEDGVLQGSNYGIVPRWVLKIGSPAESFGG